VTKISRTTTMLSVDSVPEADLGRSSNTCRMWTPKKKHTKTNFEIQIMPKYVICLYLQLLCPLFLEVISKIHPQLQKPVFYHTRGVFWQRGVFWSLLLTSINKNCDTVWALENWVDFQDHVRTTVYPLVMTNIAIENDHRNSGFSHKQWWFSSSLC